MEKFSRKDFLRISSSALALSQLWSLSGCTRQAAIGNHLKNFDSQDTALLENIWRAYVGGEAAVARYGEKGLKKIFQECTSSLDGMLESFKMDAPYLTDDFLLALKLIDYGPIILGWYGKTFGSLSLSQQQQVLQDWLDSSLKPLRDVSYGLKGLFTLLYYEHPQVRQLIGFDKPWVLRDRVQGARQGI